MMDFLKSASSAEPKWQKKVGRQKLKDSSGTKIQEVLKSKLKDGRSSPM